MPAARTWARALLLLAAARQHTAFNAQLPAQRPVRPASSPRALKERVGLAASARDDGAEERVVAAIRDGFEAGWGRPKRAAGALGAFGSASARSPMRASNASKSTASSSSSS